MRLSRTIVYAVRAVLQLGKAPLGAPIPRTQLAAAARLPERFLAEVLHSLVAGGVVRSTRGVDGGFSLARPAEQITLLEIFEAFNVPPPPYMPTADGLTTEVTDRIMEALKNATAAAKKEYRKLTLAEMLRWGGPGQGTPAKAR